MVCLVSFYEFNSIFHESFMCERKIGGDNQTTQQFARIDLCSIGNDELLVVFENSELPHNTVMKAGAEHYKRERSSPYHRIICRFVRVFLLIRNLTFSINFKLGTRVFTEFL